MTALPLEPTTCPGVYRRGTKFVAVYRRGGRQQEQTADNFTEAREIKLAQDAAARAERRGPTLHSYALRWLDRHSGSGRHALRDGTRREYRRLLITFAFRYFDHDPRIRDLDTPAIQRFVDWLTDQRGRRGRLSDRSIANALTPLRLALEAAVADGLLEHNPASGIVLPRRTRGRAWDPSEQRFLSRDELAKVLEEVPAEWRPFFDLLAVTGLRISEAIGLRWSELDLDPLTPHLRVIRAIVKGKVVAPKSRYGMRVVPLPGGLATELQRRRPPDHSERAPVFTGAQGGSLRQENLRKRVLVPAVRRAGLDGVGFHTFRHTCASLLIESGASPLRIQRWMGHHSAAYTLDAYGHLLNTDLGPPVELSVGPGTDSSHATPS